MTKIARAVLAAACLVWPMAPIGSPVTDALAQSAADERQADFERERALREMDEMLRRAIEQRGVDDRRQDDRRSLERRDLQRDLDRRELERREQDRRR